VEHESGTARVCYTIFLSSYHQFCFFLTNTIFKINFQHPILLVIFVKQHNLRAHDPNLALTFILICYYKIELEFYFFRKQIWTYFSGFLKIKSYEKVINKCNWIYYIVFCMLNYIHLLKLLQYLTILIDIFLVFILKQFSFYFKYSCLILFQQIKFYKYH